MGKRGAERERKLTEGMALGDQTAAGVDDVFTAVGDIAVADEFVGFAFGRETQGVDDAHFIGAEAVVDFDDADVVWGDAGFFHGFLSGVLGHLVPD
jgi:hypothetical protein